MFQLKSKYKNPRLLNLINLKKLINRPREKLFKLNSKYKNPTLLELINLEKHVENKNLLTKWSLSTRNALIFVQY